jgi:mannose-1-phosphate guanylyltransferase/mannose-6-phosphate isomerase
MNYKEERPWGWFEILFEEATLKIKRILVKPGKRLSLQSHERRAENWIVVQGQALVTNGEEIVRLEKRQAVFIPEKTKHRMENPGPDNHRSADRDLPGRRRHHPLSGRF